MVRLAPAAQSTPAPLVSPRGIFGVKSEHDLADEMADCIHGSGLDTYETRKYLEEMLRDDRKAREVKVEKLAAEKLRLWEGLNVVVTRIDYADVDRKDVGANAAIDSITEIATFVRPLIELHAPPKTPTDENIAKWDVSLLETTLRRLCDALYTENEHGHFTRGAHLDDDQQAAYFAARHVLNATPPKETDDDHT